MRRVAYACWQDGEWHLGHLNEYPDYITQAASKAELIENLRDLLTDLESGQVPFIRHVEELEAA